MLIVRVRWDDACFLDDYVAGDGLAKFSEEEYLLDTIGYLIAVSDSRLVLSNEEACVGSGRYRRAHNIPLAYVKEVEILKDDHVAKTSPGPATLRTLPIVSSGKRVRARKRKRK